LFRNYLQNLMGGIY